MSILACEVMQDAEKLQLAVEQMQQIVDKAHQIMHDPNLPNLLAAYDVARDYILQGILDEVPTNRIGNCSSVVRLPYTRALQYRVVLESTLTPDSVLFGDIWSTPAAHLRKLPG